VLPAFGLRELILGRKVSPGEAAAASLARVRAVDPGIRAFVTIDEAKVAAMADNVERRLSEGAFLPLAAVPYALKDLTETAGLRTTHGSKLREHFVPAHDAAVARRLREAGGVLIGKTNTPEFGNRATTAFASSPRPGIPGTRARRPADRAADRPPSPRASAPWRKVRMAADPFACLPGSSVSSRPADASRTRRTPILAEGSSTTGRSREPCVSPR
jgi:hypothetical protein